MKRSSPLQVVVYQDVLCAWCYVADPRLEMLRAEFGDSLLWKSRPYPLRVNDTLPTMKERRSFLVELGRARKEPEGSRLSPELWQSNDPPRSSIPALTALEAARLQSPDAAHTLTRAVRRMALEQGLNVTRSDILFELAQQAGLHMGRFSAAFQSPVLRKLVLDEHRAAGRRGVRGAPTLVIGERWMVSGLRDVSEYRQLLQACLSKRESRPSGGADSESLH